MPAAPNRSSESSKRQAPADCKCLYWRAECSLTLMLPCFMQDIALRAVQAPLQILGFYAHARASFGLVTD